MEKGELLKSCAWGVLVQNNCYDFTVKNNVTHRPVTDYIFHYSKQKHR
jgi:hypothetical protein